MALLLDDPPTTATHRAKTVETVADLLDQFGRIPAERVRMIPAPGSATESDQLVLLEQEHRLYELVDGTLLEKSMGYEESNLAGILIQRLNNFLDGHNLGLCIGPDGALKLKMGLIRIPDVAFLSWDLFPGRKRPKVKVPSVAPALAVEVLSDSNTPDEMARKRQEYFDAGTKLVWEVELDPPAVRVYTAPEQFTTLGIDDTLDGGDVLPGFTLSIREWFARALREGPG